jgi:FkbM family methyltransferase
MPQVDNPIRAFPRFFHNWVKPTGWRASLTWAAYRTKTSLGFQQPPILKIKPRQAKYPLIARLGDSSDMSVFNQIFNFNGYAGLRNLSSPRLILDLGANVGYSSAYFLSCFPTANVVAVEPDPDSFQLCCRNLIPYGNRAQVVLGAAWSRRCRLVLARGVGDGREWATQVHESDGGKDEATVEGWDIPSLLELAGGKEIDLLKVDVEKSELEIFNLSSSRWLPSVRTICIELHGAECEEVFLHALRDFEYDLRRFGELTICWNLRRKTTWAQPISASRDDEHSGG